MKFSTTGDPRTHLSLSYLHLIGASKDLATVTMTLVPNTWRESERESRQMLENIFIRLLMSSFQLKWQIKAK